jgi:hypothetical protein
MIAGTEGILKQRIAQKVIGNIAVPDVMTDSIKD